MTTGVTIIVNYSGHLCGKKKVSRRSEKKFSVNMIWVQKKAASEKLQCV